MSSPHTEPQAAGTGENVEDLIRRLAETEAALQALLAGQADAVVNPESGMSILLRQAQAELHRTHDELEARVAERTAELSQANEALQQSAARLEVFSQMDRAILAAQSIDDIAGIGLSHLQRLLDCRRASVALFDLEAGQMSVLAAIGDSTSNMSRGWQGPLPPASFLERQKHRQPLLIDDLAAVAPGRHPSIPILQGEDVRALMCAPLLAGEELLGSLTVGLVTPGPWLPGQVEAVCEVADRLAIGLRQARLHEQVQRHATDLEQQVAERTAALRASETRARTTFEAAGIGMAVIGRDGCLLESNARLQEMLGYGDQELRGTHFAHYLPAEEEPAWVEEQRRLARSEGKLYRREVRYVRRDGQQRWGEATVSLVRGDDGTTRFAIVMLQDTTDQKLALDALVHSEKLAVTGRLTTLLAHEINNPLQSVMGCLGLAEKSLADGGDTAPYLRVARQELRRVARIVSQLRDMNRRSRQEERQPVAVNRLVEEVMLAVGVQCQEQHIKLSWEATDNLPLLRLVPDRMQQVFLSLVMNAVEAMPQGGRLDIRLGCTNRPAGISISFGDSGPGIDPAIEPRLFEPFVSNKPMGLGLGLYISKKILEEHEGSIEVESCPGAGTTIRVWLPT